MTTTDGDGPLMQADNIQLRIVDEEAFLIDPDGGIHTLNGIGAAVWRCFAQPVRQADVAELLQTAFPDTDPAGIGADVAALVTQLCDAGLLRQPG